MVFENNDINETQHGIYLDFVDALNHHLHEPDYILYLKTTPEKAMENLKDRIAERKKMGFPTFGEENIPIEYLIQLNKKYGEWEQKMKNNFKSRFIVIENSHRKKVEDILNVLNDAIISYKKKK